MVPGSMCAAGHTGQAVASSETSHDLGKSCFTLPYDHRVQGPLLEALLGKQ